MYVIGDEDHALHAALYAAPYCGGRGGRDPFGRGARVMRDVLELGALRAVSAVGTVVCCKCGGVLYMR